MPRLRFTTILLSLFIILGLIRDCFADRRSYVWTYEYRTVPKGLSEVEYYSTIEEPDKKDPRINTFKNWIEFEHGVTDRLDLAVYQMWRSAEKPKKLGTNYDGAKVRARYRFGEKGRYFADPLFYAEYIRNARDNDPDELELKLVLAKDIGRFNIAYNEILSQALKNHGTTESEYALGLSYRLNNKLSLGVESKGNFSKGQYYYGPVFSLAFRKFWFTAGIAAAMNKKADDLQARVIVGIPF